MSASKISLERAKPNKLFYFVANVVMYRESDGRCLLLKRSARETAHPGRWAVPGGKLEWVDLPVKKPTRANGEILDFENAVEELLIRETREEAGIEIDAQSFRYINSVAFIRPDEVPVVSVKFAAKYKSGEVRIEKESFDDFAWVNAREVRNYPCIDGVPEEIKKAVESFLE